MTVIKQGSAQVDEGGAGSTLGPYRAELISDTAKLTQFGAFIEELPPGSRSSHAHWHAREDEMVLILSGAVTLRENGVETVLTQGDAACWKAGGPVAHSMENHTDQPARYLVVGTRSPADTVTYPDHDRVLHFDRISQTRRYTTLDGQPATRPE